MSGGGFDLQEWSAWGIGIVVTTLAGIVATFWKIIENRNAKDIAMLMAINDRLEKEMGEMRRSQLTMTAENAVLRNENAILKESLHNLEQRLSRYEQGHN
jgi:hypothetical protein